MFNISHAFASIFLLRIFSYLFPSVPFTIDTVILSALIGNIPDIDTIWAKKLNQHLNSPFHAPLVWIAIGIVAIFLIPGWWITLSIMIILFHIFCDYVTARSAGVIIFYPFSSREYSLYSLNKSFGDYHPYKDTKKLLISVKNHYFQNKVLVCFEVLISISGLISVFTLF